MGDDEKIQRNCVVSMSFIRIFCKMRLTHYSDMGMKCFYRFNAYRENWMYFSIFHMHVREKCGKVERNTLKFVHPYPDWSTTYGARYSRRRRRRQRQEEEGTNWKIWQILCKKIISIVNVQQSNRNISIVYLFHRTHAHPTHRTW